MIKNYQMNSENLKRCRESPKEKFLLYKIVVYFTNSKILLRTMTEQARESVKAFADSLREGSMDEMTPNYSFADDENVSVFLDDSYNSESISKNVIGNSSVGNVSGSTLEITTSVSDRVDTLGEEEPERERIQETLSNAYSTCMRRFERAVGDSIINNDIIKLSPVSADQNRDKYHKTSKLFNFFKSFFKSA